MAAGDCLPVAIARWLLSKTELSCAFLSVIYLLIIIADMLLQELVPQQCGAEASSEIKLWKFIYDKADLSFLIFFACEIILRLIAEGFRAYFKSPLNCIDSCTVSSSLVIAVLSTQFDDLSSFGVLRLFRLTRIVKMVGAYNRLITMRDRWRTRMWERRIHKSEAKSALIWRDSGDLVKCEPPRAGEDGFHLFLSHKWTHAQDNAVSIKTALSNLVPSCRTFLDVDDLENMKDLEIHVRRSDVFVVIVTDKCVPRTARHFPKPHTPYPCCPMPHTMHRKGIALRTLRAVH